MIVDASAVLAVLFAEPDAIRFATAIAHAPTRRMSAVNWLEAAMAIDRRGDDISRGSFAQFFERAAITIVPVTGGHAALARQAFATWGKGRHAAGLNMGDCIAHALARSTGEALLFKGNDFVLTDIAPALKDL